MIIRRIKFFVLFFFVAACNNELTDDPIPLTAFSDININLSLPSSASLRVDGGYLLSNGGVRGIIVYRVSSTSFQAYERNCSYHPNEACATVNVHSSALYMTDPCCGSNFSFADGTPTGGQAWRPLRRYRTQFNASTSQLLISDEALN